MGKRHGPEELIGKLCENVALIYSAEYSLPHLEN